MKKWLLFVTVVLFSCDDDKSEPVTEVPKDKFSIRTSSITFSTRELTNVIFYNYTDKVALIESCENELFYYREKLVNNITWQYWTKQECGQDTLFSAIASGTTRSEKILVGKPGTYRFWFKVFYNGVTKPDTIYSNSFSIE